MRTTLRVTNSSLFFEHSPQLPQSIASVAGGTELIEPRLIGSKMGIARNHYGDRLIIDGGEV